MNRFQRAGKVGGLASASDLQKAIARQTICITKPWKTRQYRAFIVLSSFPSTEAIEAAYSEHGFKALVSIAICNEGYLVSALIQQRRDFLPNDLAKIIEILENFKNG